jgi:hypothetical protein
VLLMMSDLPLDIDGNRCEPGRWYWGGTASGVIVGAGKFYFNHELFEARFQLPHGSHFAVDTMRYAPADPPEFPPREEPHVHD